MNSATKPKATSNGSLNAIPKDLHSLWLLLQAKITEKIAKNMAAKIGTDLFGHATRADILRLIDLGVTLGLLKNTENGIWAITAEGKKYAQLKNWRLWDANKKAKDALGRGTASTLFLGEDKLSEKPIVIDLFSGVGGLSLGFEAAGFDVKIAVDNDPQACEAHEKNFPECAVVKGDINEVAANPINLLCKANGISPSKISGVIGGPPCQGFSYMGERASHDERNLLTSRFMDIVMKLEPDFFMMENVAGLLTSGSPPKLGVYVQRLGKSIGGPATQIVEQLPEAKVAIAKRDRQFRKRTVSQAITAYRLNLFEQITDTSSLNSGAALISQIFKELPAWLEKYILKAYMVEDGLKSERTTIHSTISSTENEFAQISIGLLIDVFMERRFLEEAAVEGYLKSLAKARQTPATIKRTITQIVAEYDGAPRPQIHKGVVVGPILGHLIERASAKYDVSEPTVLNAAWYGAPQSRQRLFVVGIHKRLGKSFVFPDHKFTLPGLKSSLLDPALPMAPTAFEAIGDLPDIDQFEELREGDKIPISTLSPSHSAYAAKMRLDRIDSNDFSLPRPSWNPFVIDCCNRTIHTDDVLERLKQTAEGIQEETSHKTRLNRTKVSHTLRAGTREGKGSHTAVRPVHYEHHRVISVREGARLMGYPDWMTFHHTKWHGFRLVGNGVPFQLGNVLAKTIMDQINPTDGLTIDNASE